MSAQTTVGSFFRTAAVYQHQKDKTKYEKIIQSLQRPFVQQLCWLASKKFHVSMLGQVSTALGLSRPGIADRFITAEH